MTPTRLIENTKDFVALGREDLEWLSARLHEIRYEARISGRTAADIAEEACMSPRTVSHIISGKTTNPSAKTIRALCRTLKIEDKL